MAMASPKGAAEGDRGRVLLTHRDVLPRDNNYN